MTGLGKTRVAKSKSNIIGNFNFFLPFKYYLNPYTIILSFWLANRPVMSFVKISSLQITSHLLFSVSILPMAPLHGCGDKG